MNVINFTYTLTDTHNNVIESSEDHVLSYIEGKEQILPELERQMQSVPLGVESDLVIPSDLAFGKPNPNLIVEFPKTIIKDSVKEGDWVMLTAEDGQEFQVKIVEFRENAVLLDANHPLAGQDVVFKVKVISKRPASKAEINSGVIDNSLIHPN